VNFSTAFDNQYLGNEMVGCLREACVVINAADKIVSFNRAFEKDFSLYAGLPDSDIPELLINYLEEHGEETEYLDRIVKAIRQC
jgi:hypothetical protein